MNDKKQEQNIDELIAFLDGRMSNGGGAVKPKFNEEGMMKAEDPKLFSDGLDEECPTCAKIPNLMQFTPDNVREDSKEYEDGEEDW